MPGDPRAARLPQTYAFGPDSFYLSVVALTLASYVLEGPLRLTLHLLSLESTLYLRDLAAAVATGLVLLSWLRGQRAAAPFAAVTALLLAHCLIGMLTLPSLFQALFGLKIFLVFLLGFAAAPILSRRPRAVARFAAFCFFATALGVLLNVFVELPWLGLTYDTAFGETVAARKWWTAGSGDMRLPGFARASFTAASIMVVALIPLLELRIGLLRKGMLVVIAVATIRLTTTKGAFTALAAVLAFKALASVPKSARLTSGALYALAAMCMALPIVAVQIGAENATVPIWLASFLEGVGDLWPRAFELLEGGAWLWGRGLGGIGTAMQYGEWASFNSADNLMLYVLVSFGLLGVGYVWLFMFRLTGLLARTQTLMRGSARGFTAAWLCYGFTAGMIDLPITNLAIGIVFGLSFATASASGEPCHASPSRGRAQFAGSFRRAFGSWQSRGVR